MCRTDFLHIELIQQFYVSSFAWTLSFDKMIQILYPKTLFPPLGGSELKILTRISYTLKMNKCKKKRICLLFLVFFCKKHRHCLMYHERLVEEQTVYRHNTISAYWQKNDWWIVDYNSMVALVLFRCIITSTHNTDSSY